MPTPHRQVVISQNVHTAVSSSRLFIDTALTQRRRSPGRKLDAYGSKLRADGRPADGFFEATVTVGTPPRSVKIQGWFKEASDGTKVITSHAPAFDKSWPKVAPKDY